LRTPLGIPVNAKARVISGRRLSLLAVCDRACPSAFPLLPKSGMKFFCRHCDEEVVGHPYRVVSEEDGVILLNMTVCRGCYEQARALGLRSEPISLPPKPADFDTQECVHA